MKPYSDKVTEGLKSSTRVMSATMGKVSGILCFVIINHNDVNEIQTLMVCSKDFDRPKVKISFTVVAN